jgi:hypothetical protein
MSTSRDAVIPRKRVWIKRLMILIVLGLIGVVAISGIAGYGLDLRGFGRAVLNVVQATRNHQAVIADGGSFRNIVFLHHSVGANLIAQSGVRERLTAGGYHFWDQGYNGDGLRDPRGISTGYSYNVPGDNTDPDGLLNIFSQPVFDLPLNTLSGLMQHEVIAFKSCFPTSAITSDALLKDYQMWYTQIRAFMDQHSEKLFIIITQPPLNPAETQPEAAARARAFAAWLKSDEFLQGHPNIVAFDLFDLLAENDPQASDFNMLRADYREDTNSHPNRLANETIGPIFAEFIMQAADRQRSAEP